RAAEGRSHHRRPDRVRGRHRREERAAMTQSSAGTPRTPGSPIARLNDYGQSPWYDNIRRSLLERGDLARMIEEDGIRGVTSNPTIFEKAISAGNEYDGVIHTLGKQGLSSQDIGWELLIADVGMAADILRPCHDGVGGADGFVSKIGR